MEVIKVGLVSEENGQTVVEYAAVIAILILVIVAAIPPLRQAITGMVTKTGNALQSAPDIQSP